MTTTIAHDRPTAEMAAAVLGNAHCTYAEKLCDLTRRLAYERYLARGGTGCAALDDWLAAEVEAREALDRLLR